MVKNLPTNAGDKRDADSIPGLGRSFGKANGNALQYLKGSVNYKLALAMGAYHLPLQGLDHVRCSCCPSTPPEGVQGGEQA